MTEQPPESPEDDFDAFVAQHNIQPHEMGAAFAAWLSGFGWDGNYVKLDPRGIVGYDLEKPPVLIYENLPFPSEDPKQEACGPHQ